MNIAQIRDARQAFRRAERTELIVRHRLPDIEKEVGRLDHKISQTLKQINQKEGECRNLRLRRTSRRGSRGHPGSQQLNPAVGSKRQSIARLEKRLSALREQRDNLYRDKGLAPGVTRELAKRERIEARHRLMVLLQIQTSVDKWRELEAIARKAGVPECYISRRRLMYHDRQLKKNRRIDFFFGGLSTPDGAGHGHVAVTRSRGTVRVAYSRMPGKAH